jgi:hypothetical protein
MEAEGRPARGGKSPRSLAVKLTGSTAHNRPSKKSAAKKPAAKKNKPCKWDETMEKGYRSPKKENQRTHGGKRVSSTGLASAIKRHANNIKPPSYRRPEIFWQIYGGGTVVFRGV